MGDDGPRLTLRVFLASPGDVPAERDFAREYLESGLPQDAFVAGRVMCHVVSWDHPHGAATMPAHLTPQGAVIHYKHPPSACDIVVVILAGRLGTHLSVDALRRPDGSAYLSGTKWEFEDAWNATPRPLILVYRRNDIAPIDPRDPQAGEKRRQFGLVEQFFERFRNPDRSWKGGFQDYTGGEGFRAKFANDVKRLVVERLAGITPRPGPEPETAPIVPPPRCFGRDADVATLIAALDTTDPAALLVLGAAGIGKTTLTRRVATDPAIAARFGHRRWFVALETVNDAASMQAAIVEAIGLNPAAARFAEALAFLARSPGLLVLDNLETPWEQDQRAVQDTLQMLAATLGVSLLASLRGGVAPSSPRWTRRPTALQPLPEDDAQRLFLELAPGIAAGDPHLALLLRELGGVPLAVELVALRAAGDTSLRELWAEWRRRGVELAAHTDLAPDHRLTSLTRSLDLSWRSRRLREEGRRLFRLLGQSPAGLAEADRDVLLGDMAAEAARQLRSVGLAVDRDGRLDLLPPVRGYAQAAQRPEPEELDRWCRHFLSLAEALGDQAGRAGSGAFVARLTPELANLDAAFMASLAGDRRPAAVAGGFGYHVLLRWAGLGRNAPLQALADACEQAGDHLGAAHCIQRLGDIALQRSDHDAARAAYQQALPLHQQVGDVLGEANCIKSLGDIALRRSDHDAARVAYQQALPLHQQVGDVLGEANCIQSLGDIALARSDHDAARAAYQQALPLFQQVGNVLGEANCIACLGNIALRRSDHDAARAAYQQALPLYRQVGQVLGEANCIRSLGDIALARSDHDAARAAYQQALPLYQQVGQVLGEANCIRSLGDIADRSGDKGAARARYEEALALYQRIAEPYSIGWTHRRLARISDGAERDSHLAAARRAWASIDRTDLIAQYLDPLG